MPYLDPQLPIPFTGRSPQARHASYSGAKAQAEKFTAKQNCYLEHLWGPMTDQDMAEYLGWPLSSVNSIRNSLGDLIVADGFVTKHWDNGRTTKRVLWKVRG
jgi:hypothetical protein